jgi:hypothetical protein
MHPRILTIHHNVEHVRTAERDRRVQNRVTDDNHTRAAVAAKAVAACSTDTASTTAKTVGATAAGPVRYAIAAAARPSSTAATAATTTTARIDNTCSRNRHG